MTVGELKDLLSKFDEDCEILVSSPDPHRKYCSGLFKVAGLSGCAKTDENKWRAVIEIYGP